MDYSPPGSSVHGILQAKILEWVTIPFSRGSSWPRGETQFSCIAGGFFTIWASREALGQYETTRNTSQLTGSLRVHSSVNLSWQTHEKPSLSRVGAPRSLRGLLVWLGSRLVTPALNSFQAKTISAGLCGWIYVVSIKHLSTFQGCPSTASLGKPGSACWYLGSSSCLQTGWLPPGWAHKLGCLVSWKDVSPTICLSGFQREWIRL